MNILDKIIEYKREEVAARKSMVSEAELMDCEYFDRTTLSLSENLLKQDASGIIAEFKRKSPSKGFIHKDADVAITTNAYTANGASGLSVLTDYHFFGGSTQDLIDARINAIPILRKDFVIDTYQILEAKAIGADVILLIAACLSKTEVQHLAAFAKQLNLEVLLELHVAEELDHICNEINMVGINNRDLKSFKVDINRSIALSKLIPEDKIKIAESGISEPETIKQFKQEGYRGFLIGETFMKEKDPGAALNFFVNKIK
jgi:indole-3-glycerol phosphate synthase